MAFPLTLSLPCSYKHNAGPSPPTDTEIRSPGFISSFALLTDSGMKIACLVLLLATLAYANKEFPAKFLGSWTVAHDENFDEYLTAKGYGWFMRKLVRMASITKIFEKAADPGKYNCKIRTTKKNVDWLGFEMEKTFVGEYLDDAMHNITFTYDQAKDTLFEKHTDATSEKPTIYEYQIVKDELKMKMQHENVICYRYYTKNKPE
ncbi:unnamed protein product [Bursaphelenchus xylophilus]|uniref:(pine wood nematode) hypothetical protein n=1 Tax=Bursaphelenchus xylophilus TaxID=6326 RepID=A0A1I7SMN2_BURXY|nr:unnamed protein product [Bursaphelenchus xylophilus]CAG9130294.1 unnamed protein product [Bursaphelenchus xylophilus]